MTLGLELGMLCNVFAYKVSREQGKPTHCHYVNMTQVKIHHYEML